MYFYQSQWFFDGMNNFGELRSTPEEAMKDLQQMGYEIIGLRSETNNFPLFDLNRNIGIAIVRV
jgi:hypothetical protein